MPPRQCGVSTVFVEEARTVCETGILGKILRAVFPLAFDDPPKKPNAEEKLFDAFAPVRAKIGAQVNEAGGLEDFLCGYMRWLKEGGRIERWESNLLEDEQPYVAIMVAPAIKAMREAIETGRYRGDAEQREKWLGLLRTLDAFVAGTIDEPTKIRLAQIREADPNRPATEIAKDYVEARIRASEKKWDEPAPEGFLDAYEFRI